jgi:hypothetical protein
MPFGLKSSRRAGGAPNGKAINKYRTANGYATALFAGDPVALSAGTIVRAANGDQVIGVVESLNYNDATKRSVFSQYLPASTSSSGMIEGDNRPLVLVVDDPDATFLIAAASALVVSAGQVGALGTVSIGTGNQYSSQSGAVLNAVTTSLDASMFRILGKYDTPDNNYDVSGAIYEVVFSNHALK